MPGRPFQKGADPRRHMTGPAKRHGKTLKALARDARPETFERLRQLRDQDEDRRIALEASKLLAAYSDGEPGPANLPDEGGEAESSGEDAKILELLRQQPEGD